MIAVVLAAYLSIQLHGRVVDDSGAAIPAPQIRVYRAGTIEEAARTTSDANGGFTIADLDTVPMMVIISAPNFQQRRISVRSGAFDLGTIRLDAFRSEPVDDGGNKPVPFVEIPPSRVVLRGSVADLTGGAIANATIRVVRTFPRAEFASAPSNERGEFETPALRPDFYTAFISGPGFQTREVAVKPGQRDLGTIRLEFRTVLGNDPLSSGHRTIQR